jgi:tetratricopeptide (TPR) repeat protein
VDAQRYDVAISHYSLALSLDPPSPQSILIKRGEARLETGSWKQAVDDANQVYCLT